MPNAPFITKEELAGFEDLPVFCPVCGKSCKEIYLFNNDEVGCENCSTFEMVDAREWAERRD